jgi:hypothetical protein
MKLKVSVILALLILTSTGILLSEEQPAPQVTNTTNVTNVVNVANVTSVSPSQPTNDLNTQWAWGEVVNADAQNKTITIKYLDYEADQEKELSLVVDDSTTFDNVKSFEEIKPKDNLSIDYVTTEGKNIAKSISLEKPESSPKATKLEVAQPDTTATPQVEEAVNRTENADTAVQQASQGNQ